MGEYRTDARIGWLWVAGQALLLALLILLPGRSDWPKPAALQYAAGLVFVIGVLVMAAAALRLGGSLTPTPVPTANGALATTGLYRFVRHPIYTGVMLVAVGIVLWSQSWLHVALGIATVVFFDRKAAWEERHLRARYLGYAAYARSTPKFVPFTSLRSPTIR